MAISKQKKRIDISLPIEQAKWLNNFTKSRGITISKYISFLLYYKADEMLRILKIGPVDEEMLEILKTKWIED